MNSVQESLGNSNRRYWSTLSKAEVLCLRRGPGDAAGLAGPCGANELTTVVGASAGRGTCSVTAALLRILITHFAGGMR